MSLDFLMVKYSTYVNDSTDTFRNKGYHVWSNTVSADKIIPSDFVSTTTVGVSSLHENFDGFRLSLTFRVYINNGRLRVGVIGTGSLKDDR